MNTRTWIYHIEGYEGNNFRAYWVGECEGIPIRTNVLELQGELVEFSGDTRQEVIDLIKNLLGVDSLCIVN
jgi:hypothetical protein